MQGSVNIGGRQIPAALGLAILSSVAGAAAGCGDPDCITCGKQPKAGGTYPDIKSHLEKAGFDVAKSPDATVIGIRITPAPTAEGEGTTAASDAAGQTTQTDEAALKAAIDQDIVRDQAARAVEDHHMVDFINERLRTNMSRLMHVDLGSPAGQVEVDELDSRIRHLRNTRALLLARSPKA